MNRRVEALKAQIATLADDEDKASVHTRTRLEKELAELGPRAEAMKIKISSRKGVDRRRAGHPQGAGRRADAPWSKRARTTPSPSWASSSTSPFPTSVAASKPPSRRRSARALHAVSDGVDENDVAATLNDWTGIPVAKMLEGEAEKLLKMEERLARRVVGQDEAVRAIAKAVRRGRVGLRDPGKPIGSFLFLGSERCRQDRARRRRSPSFSSTTSKRSPAWT